MEAGASEDYANQLADSYIERYKATGETWKWNAMSDDEWQLKQDEMNLKKQKASGSGSGGGQQVLNQLFPAIQRLGNSGQPSSMMMGNSDTKFFEQNLGLKYDNTTNQIKPTKPIAGVDAQTGMSFDLSNALSINMSGKYVGKKNKDGILEQYIEATVMYDADNPGANNPHKESGPLQDDALVDDNLRHNWTRMTPAEAGLKNENVADLWKGTVLIPITEQINTPTIRDEANKARGIKSNFQAAAAGADYVDYLGYTKEQVSSLAEQYGISEQEVLQELANQQSK